VFPDLNRATQMKMYASMVPPNTLEFFRSGARAEKNLQAGGDMTTFQGKEVFETRDFAVCVAPFSYEYKHGEH
jgi:hypothetical protein